jgi:hypothetical protein
MEPNVKPSRIAAARARAAAAKRVLAVGAVCAFGGALLLARISHPAAPSGSKATGSSSASSSTRQSVSSDEFFDDDVDSDGGSIGQAQPSSVPQVRTRSS